MNWIDIRVSKPKKNNIEEVICAFENGTVFPMTWRFNDFYFFDGSYIKFSPVVTHWAYLPKHPKK